MAEIVQSLFGVTPQMYQQQQQDRMDAQALQYARLSPFERASFGIQRGANMLGGAIGGALGGQDPELQRITRAQQIASQIDFTDPQSFKQGMAALGDDTQSKLQLAQIYRQQQESGALIGQRNAAAQASIAQATRERAPPAAPTTPDLTNARAIAAQAGPEGSPEYNAAFRAEYQRLTTKEPKEPKGPAFGTDREAVAAEVYDKPFALLSPTERAVVNKRVEDENKSKAKAGATTLALPGQKELVDIPAFRAKVQATIDAPLKALQAIDNALPQIEDAIKTDNFATYRAAQTQFARAIAGAGDLSQKELKAAGADPSLLGGAADYLSQLATSTPTKDTMQKMRSAMQIIQRVNTARAQSEIDRQRKMAAQSGYPTAALDTALDFGLQTAPAAGGTLAEQAAAELKRRQSKGK
jgi:hypothetical protein